MAWNVNGLKLWTVLTLFNIDIPFINTAQPVDVTLDTIQFTSDFELNAIPKATMVIALGRRMDNVNSIALLHRLVSFLKLRIKVNVYMQVTSTASEGLTQLWPRNTDGSAKTFKIFEGYTVGSGYRKTIQGVEFTLFATHWLEDLNFSSMLSRLFQPLNPQQYSFLPAFPNFSSGDTTDIVGTTAAHNLFDSDVLRNDFWGYAPADSIAGGLKKWFVELASTDLIMAHEIHALTDIAGGDDGKNDEALTALAKIEPIPDINIGGPFGNDYLDGVPLTLDADDSFTDQVAEQIAGVISAETFFTLANHTFWDKLIGNFCPNFMFSIVPQVEKALIVPFMPGLRTAYKTITAEEYDVTGLDENTPRMLKGVGLVMGVNFAAGGDVTGNPQPAYDTIGGWFQGRPTGTIMLKDSPQWLSDVAMPYLDTFPTIGIDAPVASALTPGAGTATGRDIKNLFTRAKVLWDKYAQSLYMMEILRGRHGTISGKLRFDICPGSTVAIEGSDDKFIEGDFAQTKIGHVLRVSTAINAETQRAGTALHVAYIRDEVENTDDATSIERHPLWKNKWLGAPLANL